MKSRTLVLILGVVIVGLMADRVRRRGDESAVPPPLPAPQTVDVRDVVSYATTEATTFRVRTTRDVLPGGYSAAMAPVLVDWHRSDLSAAGHIVIRNINDRGNPVSGVTTLRTVRIHLDRIEAVELVMVPLGGPEAMSHGQLRFVFAEGGAEYIGVDEPAVGEPDALGDLVLSWEAWRPPGVDYDVMQGMDPHAYELSLRGYSGAQRFLEDALGNRDWNVYTLRLPGGREGSVEMLKVALALGDGAARHSLSRMFGEAQEQWAATGPAAQEDGDAMAQWLALEEAMRQEAPPESDPRIDMRGRTGYQSLLRSCATMALYSIQVTVSRLLESGMRSEGMRSPEMADIDEEPPWMGELASADIGGLFARAPRAIRFVRAHPTVIPSKIPQALDEAGLLVRENGKPVRRRYSMKAETPWGHRDQLLIR